MTSNSEQIQTMIALTRQHDGLMLCRCDWAPELGTHYRYPIQGQEQN